ncbi:histone H1-like [Lampris incognitus]|uniref:histone H1-like n=1 Tax=Lampris incognitus TaxID=2546036 RepID=UPI0024B4F225|nr:histone H1-like [Lampris incognitus]
MVLVLCLSPASCTAFTNRRSHLSRVDELHRIFKMAEEAPAQAAAAAPAKAPKKKAPRPKKVGPSVGELITKALAASKERGGMSLSAIKKALASSGYDVEKNNARVKAALKGLVTKETVVQMKGVGASGSFKLNKKAVEAKTTKPKKAAPKAKKPATKKAAAAKKPKKAAPKPAAKKSPKKAKKPAAAAAKKSKATKKVAKSPKKAAKKPVAAKKSPAKKAAKPKATKAKKAASKK